jgi:hypothetical protein
VQAAMRHSGFRVVVSNFNLLSCPQSARLFVEGRHVFKSHGSTRTEPSLSRPAFSPL